MNISGIAIAEAISLFAHTRLGHSVFERVIWCVKEQEKKVLDGIEKSKQGAAKRAGAIALMETIGLELSENLMRQGIELAVDYLRHAEGDA